MILVKPNRGKTSFRTAAGAVTAKVVGHVMVVETDSERIAKHLMLNHGFKPGSMPEEKSKPKPKAKAPAKKRTTKRKPAKKSS